MHLIQVPKEIKKPHDLECPYGAYVNIMDIGALSKRIFNLPRPNINDVIKFKTWPEIWKYISDTCK